MRYHFPCSLDRAIQCPVNENPNCRQGRNLSLMHVPTWPVILITMPIRHMADGATSHQAGGSDRRQAYVRVSWPVELTVLSHCSYLTVLLFSFFSFPNFCKVEMILNPDLATWATRFMPPPFLFFSFSFFFELNPPFLFAGTCTTQWLLVRNCELTCGLRVGVPGARVRSSWRGATTAAFCRRH